METIYYHILDLDIIGKEENFVPYLYDNKKGWIPDRKKILMDRVMGHDTSEAKKSPYAIGNTEMMDSVKRISKEDVERFINRK